MNRYRPSELATFLENVADDLEEYGWRANPFASDPPAYDLFGRILANARTAETEELAWSALATQIRSDYGYSGVYTWNVDQRDRRKVVRLVRRTARNLRDHKLIRTRSFGMSTRFHFNNSSK